MIYGLVPARGGSKGLPRKNLLHLGGKPLIAHTIEAGLVAEALDEVFVSSDSEEILAVGQAAGAKTFKRPEELASDTSSSDSVISHFILSQGLHESDIVVLLQPTSPFRTSAHIDAALKLYREGAAEAVVAMKEADECPFKGFKVENGFATGYFGPDKPFPRRQDHPELVFANGSIYVFSVERFMANECIPREGIVPYLMDFQSSLDIDNLEDLLMAEILLEKRNGK